MFYLFIKSKITMSNKHQYMVIFFTFFFENNTNINDRTTAIFCQYLVLVNNLFGRKSEGILALNYHSVCVI